MKTIKLKCKKCNTVVFSNYPGHYCSCECGAIAIDQNEYYARIIGEKEDIIDLKKDSKNYVCIDTETGGLDPNVNSLLTIAIIVVKDNENIYEQEFKIKSNVYNCTAKALEINKINLIEHDKEALHKDDVWNSIKEIVQKTFENEKPVVVGHNINFDLSFIHSKLAEKKEWEKVFSYRTMDTASIAMFLHHVGVIKTDKFSLDSLIDYYEIENDTNKRHSALYDANCTLEILNKMMEEIDESKNMG